ncbi:MAG TPA: hypothetical protein DEB39_06510 [Planctomycetaceae bacterium]|nr:hypothetical protein [Planctomycetaceae bacterium]
MMIGLLPKDNLLSLLLFLWLFLAGGNMLFGIVSAFFCSIASRWTASIADSLGTAALDSEWGEAVFSRLYEYPLVPWTDLNNTVVLGQFLIALGLFLPVFLFVWGMCPRGKAPEERDQT